jgi:ribose 5-phosphate isomerase B
MSITANKVPGVRAAQCHDVYSAERARKSNDAQVLTMGQRVIGQEAAKTVLDAWMASEFGGGSSTKKVEKMKEIDRRYHRNIA